jgi:hypothetical protein
MKKIEVNLVDSSRLTFDIDTNLGNPCYVEKKCLHIKDSNNAEIAIIPYKQIKSVIIKSR